MNWRERLADWISGGALSLARRDANDWRKGASFQRSEANYIARRADEITMRAEAYRHFMRAILTARNITEARKIARQALGEAE